MQVVKTLILAAAASMASAGHTRSTDMVTAEFMGSSGQMRLAPNDDPSNWIQVRQLKIEEVYPNGTAVSGPKKRMNVAGKNEWKDFVEIRDLGRSVDTTEFEVLGDNEPCDFKLMAHFAELTSTLNEAYACGNETCTKSVTVQKDEIKFSVAISNWNFDHQDNKLRYGLVISTNYTWGDDVTLSPEADSRTSLTAEAGEIVIPTKASIDSGAASTEVDVDVKLSTEGDDQVILFTFPSFSEGQTLYYDPDLTVAKQPEDPDAPTSGAATFGTSVAGVALFSVINMIMA